MLLKELYVDVSMRLLGPSKAKDCLHQASTVHESHLPSSHTSPPRCHSLVFQNSQAVCFMCASPCLYFYSHQCGTRCLHCHCPGSSLSQLHPFVRVLTEILATVPKCRITVQRFRVGTHIAALSPSTSVPSDNRETIFFTWLFKNSSR